MSVRRKLFGVGVNDSDYPVQINEDIHKDGEKRRQRVLWRCPYYSRWANIMERTNSEIFRRNNPTYRDCTVSEEWKTFSTFKKWMETQNWVGNHLDKDILVYGNMHYSEETCVFVSPIVNTFMNDHKKSRGMLPLGVTRHGKRFRANIRHLGMKEHIGVYDTPDEAHHYWIIRKMEIAADILVGSDQRVVDSIMGRLEELRIKSLESMTPRNHQTKTLQL